MDNGKVLLLLGLATWVGLKWWGLGTWTWEVSNQTGIFLNLGWVTIIAAYHAHRLLKSDLDYFSRWKICAKKTLAFVVLLVITMGVWHFVWVPEPMETRKIEQLELLEEWIYDDAALAAFRSANPNLAEVTSESIYAQQAESIETMFSPLFYLGMVTMAWAFAALSITAVFSLVFPKIWQKA